MSYRLQPFPTSGTREARTRQPLAEPRGAPRLRPEDAKFFRSWFVSDFEPKTIRPRGRVNWSAGRGTRAGNGGQRRVLGGRGADDCPLLEVRRLASAASPDALAGGYLS